MKVFVKVLGFSLALTLFFTVVANLLPQVEGEAPEDKEIELAAVSLEEFAGLGEQLFEGKGKCTLCHNPMGRAPDILALNMVETAAARLQDPRYQGQAADAEAYLRESMTDPSVYVVKGYGKKGTDDTESPMPNARKPPIELSDAEVTAVIAYMQAKDGNPVTVALPTEPSATVPAKEEAVAVPQQPAPAKTAEAALTRYGCVACHTVLTSQSPLGPRLTDVGARMTPAEIRQSIIDPNAVIADGFAPNMMPGDFADKMTARELEMIVQFLATRKG